MQKPKLKIQYHLLYLLSFSREIRQVKICKDVQDSYMENYKNTEERKQSCNYMKRHTAFMDWKMWQRRQFSPDSATVWCESCQIGLMGFQSPKYFLVGAEKDFSKSNGKGKGMRTAKTILKKKEEVGRITLPTTATISYTTQGCEERGTDRRTDAETSGPEQRAPTPQPACGHPTSDRGGSAIQRRKEFSFQPTGLGQRDAHREKQNEPRPSCGTYYTQVTP